MICQEETEPDRWEREQGQDEEWADASAHQSMANSQCMDSDVSVAAAAEASWATALVVVLRESTPRLRKKTRWNSNAQHCNQGLIK